MGLVRHAAGERDLAERVLRRQHETLRPLDP
jgi:hypothetical protein